MNIIRTILRNLERIGIYYEENYDPGGMIMYMLHLRKSSNPFIVYSDDNPNHVFIAISTRFSAPRIASMNAQEKVQLEGDLRVLCRHIKLPYDISVTPDAVDVCFGMNLNVKDCTPSELIKILRVVIDSYDIFMDLAIPLLEID